RRRRASLRPHGSVAGRHRRSDGHADDAVHESGRVARRVRWFPVVPVVRRDQAVPVESTRAVARRHRRDGRRWNGGGLCQSCAARRPLVDRMKACILAIGSEMLTPFRVDTNSLFITDRLNTIGCDVLLKAVVADDIGELAEVITGVLAWSDVLVVTGGLGPTEAYMTRDAVAGV